MKKYLFASLCVALFALSGCGNKFNYNPQWKYYSSNTGAEWQVNQDHYVEDSDTKFQWTIYTATKSRNPDFSYWTTGTSWRQLSPEQAKKQLGSQWKLVPPGHFYFYALSMPSTAWSTVSTMIGVSTSQQNTSDNKRLVKDIIYGPPNASPIFLTTVPLQLTSITTNRNEQSVTYTWEPLSSSNPS